MLELLHLGSIVSVTENMYNETTTNHNHITAVLLPQEAVHLAPSPFSPAVAQQILAEEVIITSPSPIGMVTPTGSSDTPSRDCVHGREYYEL